MTGESLPASFRDPSGFVFQRDGVLFRQVNPGYRESYELLMSSGLYQALVERELMIAHQEAGVAPASEPAFKVLRPDRVPFVSYPYEWCFGELREAALATLEVQRVALEHGMSLKDASAYNV
jgi:hypothetical protein